MRFVSAALGFLLLFSIFSSCSKEKSFEVDAPATGSLQNDETNDCLPKTAVGAFIAGTVLTDSNYLLVDIDVKTLGSYAIHTDTANGYAFSGMGNFDKTGINQVQLMATGTPIAAGTDEFTVFFDSSFCFLPVTVLPAGSSGAAAFTLQGSGDSCILATAVSGTYTQNQALGSANKVDIKVNTTTEGSYTVTTNTVNGFSFSGSGTLVSPGEHTITLTASGLPTAAGSTVFTVSAGGTTCSFVVTVVASNTPPPVGTANHFPLTTGSSWTYAFDENDLEDSTVITNKGTATTNGNPYNLFEFSNASDGTAYDTAYYRKSGNDYYAYMPMEAYTSLPFDTEVKGDILFLKENLNTGDTWNSAEFSGTYSNAAFKVQYVFTCTDANATVNVMGKTYTDVYKITAKPQASTGGSAYLQTGEEIERYFAKGIGLIYEKGSVNGSTDYESFMIRYKVN